MTKKRQKEKIKILVDSINQRPLTRDDIVEDIRISIHRMCAQLESSTKIDDLKKKTSKLNTVELIELGLEFVELKTCIDDFTCHLENL